MKCLGQRIADPNFLWLIRTFLRAGVMSEGKIEPTVHGTPQGGIISPILAKHLSALCLRPMVFSQREINVCGLCPTGALRGRLRYRRATPAGGGQDSQRYQRTVRSIRIDPG